jgi:hypothetical protein
MTLPEIPQGAELAAAKMIHQCPLPLTETPGCAGFSGRDTDVAHGALLAAWPHLYAAALRHAADRLRPDYAGSANRLRKMADEAEQA